MRTASSGNWLWTFWPICLVYIDWYWTPRPATVHVKHAQKYQPSSYHEVLSQAPSELTSHHSQVLTKQNSPAIRKLSRQLLCAGGTLAVVVVVAATVAATTRGEDRLNDCDISRAVTIEDVFLDDYLYHTLS